MQLYEYTVIPAPARGEKVRGARTGAERFSYALLTEMNRMAANGWEYVRAETLPCEERSGLTSRTTVYHNVLVFRRAIAQQTAHHQRPLAAEPQAAPAMHRPAPQPQPEVQADNQWPDGDSQPAAAASEVDDYAEPGFDSQDLQGDAPAEPPAFTRRPPLSAARPGDAVVPAAARLGPAER